MIDSRHSNPSQTLVWSVVGLVAVTVLWLLLAPHVVPDLVLKAYQDRYPNPQRMILWHGVFGCVAIWAGGWLVWWSVRKHILDRLIPEASAQQLGGIRVVVCAVLLTNTLWEDLASTSYLPKEMRLPLGVIKVLQQLPIGFEQLLDSYAALSALKYFTAGFLVLGCLGFATRLVIPLAALGYLLVGGILREYSHGFHTNLLPLQLLIVLAFLPCGDGLSIDRQIRHARGKAVASNANPRSGYGWSVFICWTVIAMAYFAAGLSKLRTGGWLWWHHENMQTYLFQSSLNPMHFDFRISLALREAPDFVFAALGFGGLLIELFYPLVLFSRMARIVFPALALGLHIGIFFLQNILFLDLMLLQIVFWPWTGLFARLPRPFAFRHREFQAEADVSALRSHPGSIRKRILGTITVPAIVCVSMFVWAMDCEFYPASAWGMFKFRNSSGVLTYQKPLVFYSNGDVEEAKFDRWIGAMADTRYRQMLEVKRHPELAEKFFDASIARANAADSKGRTVDHFEIETWRWDFRNEPQSATYGKRVNSVIYPRRDNDRKSESLTP